LTRGAALLTHLESAVGFDVQYVRRPLVILDHATGEQSALVDGRTTLTALYGLGLLDFAQLSLALPAVFQSGTGRSVYTGVATDALARGAAGDLQLDLAARWPEPLALGPAALTMAVASGLSVPTGDSEAFTGSPGVSGVVEAMGWLGWGPLRVGVDVGVIAREPSALLDRRVGSEVFAATTAGVSLFDEALSAMVGVRATFPLIEGGAVPVLWMAEGRARLLPDRRLQLALGAGTGLGDAVRSPALMVVASLAYVPGSLARPDGGR
jgi:hypothetical protein